MIRTLLLVAGTLCALSIGTASCGGSNDSAPGSGGSGGTTDAGVPDAPADGSADASSDTEAGEPDADASSCLPFVDRQLGTVKDDEVRALAVDGERIILVGYEGGTLGLQSIEPGGNTTGFVSILDRNGVEQRRIDLDSAGTDVVEAAAVRPSDGRLAVVGRTTGDLAGVNAGQHDTFVALLDGGSADPIVAQMGDARPQHPRSLAWHGDSLFVAGFDDIYIPTNYVEAWEDAWVERWTLVGNVVTPAWRFVFGTADGDLISGLAVDASGTPYVSGTQLSGLGAGPFVRATAAADGSELWRHLVAPFGSDHAAVLMIDSTGSLLAIGSSYASFGTPAGDQDVFVLRMDPKSGKVIAATSTGSSAADWVTAASLDSAGNLYVAGETFGGLAGAPPPAGERDMFVVRFDSSLDVTGKWQSGRAGNDSATGVAVDACGRVLVSGWTEGSWIAGAALGGRDGVLARVDF